MFDVTASDMRAALDTFQIAPDSIIITHSSLKAPGTTENGPHGVIKAIFDTVPNQYSLRLKLVTDPNNNIYVVHDTENQTTTVIYIVEKTA